MSAGRALASECAAAARRRHWSLFTCLRSATRRQHAGRVEEAPHPEDAFKRLANTSRAQMAEVFLYSS